VFNKSLRPSVVYDNNHRLMSRVHTHGIVKGTRQFHLSILSKLPCGYRKEWNIRLLQELHLARLNPAVKCTCVPSYKIALYTPYIPLSKILISFKLFAKIKASFISTFSHLSAGISFGRDRDRSSESASAISEEPRDALAL